jgi:hypothetical protein
MNEELNKISEDIEKYKLTDSLQIKEIKQNILDKMSFEPNEIKQYQKLLKNYRYVDEIDELRYGSYIRYFNISKPSLNLLRGGFIVDIKNVKDDIQILCKNGFSFFNIKLGQSVIFQKNTSQEELLIQILDHIK